jgi:phosphosulfolactate phosphohydrolase-like enzyme
MAGLDHTLILITPHGVYELAGAPHEQVVATSLTALQYAARHLSHAQWSEVLAAERSAGRTIILPADRPADRRSR